jgi:hypothetical protein
LYRRDVRTATDPRRALRWTLAGALALVSAAHAQQPPELREEVEVREVGVIADLPASLRGLSAAELAQRLTILEDGAERQPTSVAALLTGSSGGFERVLVGVDQLHCVSDLVSVAAAALGSEANRLTRLGPVEIVRVGQREESLLAPTTTPGTVAEALARLAGAPDCPVAAEMAPGPAPALARLACPRGACLLVWVGPGWQSRDDGAPAPASRQELDPLVRGLAGAGWTVLAVPLSRRDETAPRPAGKEPETRPGSRDSVWTINLLGRDRGQALSPADYERFLDVWLAPLRRMVAATAGELARWDDEVGARLEALAGRSVLYYRTERKPNDQPPALEVREPGAESRPLRVAEWAPWRPR